VLGLGIAGIGVGAFFFFAQGWTGEVYKGPFHVVQYEPFTVTIVERGNLEAAENSDIICRVKVGNRASNTIKWVVDDGTHVRKGDKLVEFDDSALQDQFKVQANAVNKAKAEMVKAEEDYQIVRSQNFSDIESARTARVLAELDLKKLLGDKIAEQVAAINDRHDLLAFIGTSLEGLLKNELSDLSGKSISEIVQSLSDIEGRIETARSDREMWVDRYAWSQRMVKKGYLSRAQAEADKAKLDSTELSLRKVQTELDIFRRYLIGRNVTDLWSKLKESERSLERTITQARSKELQAKANYESARAIYDLESSKLQDIKDEIDKCHIVSPRDGLVVYYISEASRYGSSSQSTLIAVGESVRENQKLMRIPNLTHMLVNVRVHEAMVSRLRGDVTRPTHFSDYIQAVSFVTGALTPYDLTVRQTAQPDIRDVFRDKDSKLVSRGQPAKIRVEAFPNEPYTGHVKSVATVASQADFMSDVKVYQTIVSIDREVSNLKPGMSAEVAIIADSTNDSVLTVPIQAVLGNISMGESRKCFVLDNNNRPHLRDIVVGMSNDQKVEVKSGLAPGERVVLNAESLVGEKSELRAKIPGLQRNMDFDPAKGGKKGKPGAKPSTKKNDSPPMP
jgi:multidrug efflux pump subunit AcrA (membrane-fusion protein)